MLTDEKRKKLLAGALAVVMLTGVAGCGNDKDSEWKNDNSAQNNQDEKKDEDFSFQQRIFIHDRYAGGNEEKCHMFEKKITSFFYLGFFDDPYQ